MKNIYKKIIAIVCAGVLLCSFSACNKNDVKQEETTDGVGLSAESETASEAPFLPNYEYGIDDLGDNTYDLNVHLSVEGTAMWSYTSPVYSMLTPGSPSYGEISNDNNYACFWVENHILCIDVHNGLLLWETALEETIPVAGKLSDARLMVIATNSVIYVFSLEDGKIVTSKDTGESVNDITPNSTYYDYEDKCFNVRVGNKVFVYSEINNSFTVSERSLSCGYVFSDGVKKQLGEVTKVEGVDCDVYGYYQGSPEVEVAVYGAPPENGSYILPAGTALSGSQKKIDDFNNKFGYPSLHVRCTINNGDKNLIADEYEIISNNGTYIVCVSMPEGEYDEKAVQTIINGFSLT